MSCFCFGNLQSNNSKNKNTFNSPKNKTYFTSVEEYNSYINSKYLKNKEINGLIELFPNDNNININNFDNNKSKIKNERGALHREVKFISKDYYNIKYPNLSIHCYSIKNPSNLKNEIILLRIKNNCFDSIKQKSKNKYIFKSKNSQEDLENEKFKFLNYRNYTDTDTDSYSVDYTDINEKTEKITLVISHSNSNDLGTIFPKLCDLAVTLKCDVISYDYTGYGSSSNKPNFNSLKNDIITVLNFSIDTFELKNEDIVLVSFNIGAIPTLNAASNSQYCSIRGMILISPFLNFIKEFNYECINDIICPVFIIHGDNEDNIGKNEIISFTKKFEEGIHWVPKDSRTYEEIMDENRYKFYKKLRKFLKHVQTTREKISQNITDSKNSTFILK